MLHTVDTGPTMLTCPIQQICNSLRNLPNRVDSRYSNHYFVLHLEELRKEGVKRKLLKLHDSYVSVVFPLLLFVFASDLLLVCVLVV